MFVYERNVSLLCVRCLTNVKQNMSNTNTRIRKSERLSKEEHKALKSARKGFSTMVEFSEVVGVSRQVLDRVLLFGSGSSESVKVIREYLEREEATTGA